MQGLAVPVPLLVLLLHPVVLAILYAAFFLQRLREEIAQIVVIGRVFESEVAHIGEVESKLLGEAFAELLDRGRLLLLANLLVLLLISSSLETLPRQATTQKVHKHVSKRLEIVSSRLLSAEMGVDAHVPGGSRERLAFPVGDVLLRLGVTVLLRHTKIDNVDDVGSLGARSSDQEIVGLDISVDEVLLVDGLHARQLQGVGQIMIRVNILTEGRTICFATMTTVLRLNLRLQ